MSEPHPSVASPLLAILAMLSPALPLGAAPVIESRYQEPFPAAASIKGLQVEMVDDALALGVKHAALNVNLSQLIDPRGMPGNPTWELEGKSFAFQRGYLEQLDRQIKPLSDRGVLVYLIMLAYQSGDEDVNRLALHPGYDRQAPNRLGAFNIVTPDGRQWFTAAFELLAERWSQPAQHHGRVAGYILGNEVNSHWWWSNMGRVSMDTFAHDYARAARLAHDAIRRQSSWGRLYLSLEHHWNIRFGAGDEKQAFPGRPFLERFASLVREEGDFDWHLAFHPYPKNLFEPRFWLDQSATGQPDTPRITFKNLEVLTRFMRRPDMLHAGSPRRIILSEQGFHTPKGPDGERIQAAAYCHAYRKVAGLDGIDAFILHRHVDHPHEGGLLLGLRRFTPDQPDPRPRKMIYECFRLADTAEWEEAFRFALPVAGRNSWDESVEH